MEGYVYLIGNRQFGWFKIGKSRTPEVRVKNLGIILPYKIEVVAVWKTTDHSRLETYLHKKYAAHQINGEWFKFSNADISHIQASRPEERIEVLPGFYNIEKESKERLSLKGIHINMAPLLFRWERVLGIINCACRDKNPKHRKKLLQALLHVISTVPKTSGVP